MAPPGPSSAAVRAARWAEAIAAFPDAESDDVSACVASDHLWVGAAPLGRFPGWREFLTMCGERCGTARAPGPTMGETRRMDDASADLNAAVAGTRAMHVDGDPGVILNGYLAATELRRAGLVSALTLLASSALDEMDRLGGEGAGLAWLDAQQTD